MTEQSNTTQGSKGSTYERLYQFFLLRLRAGFFVLVTWDFGLSVERAGSAEGPREHSEDEPMFAFDICVACC